MVLIQISLKQMRRQRPLTLQQRQKKRLQMRRLAPIIARKRKIALRKKANRGQLVETGP